MNKLFILIALMTTPCVVTAGVLDDFIEQKQNEKDQEAQKAADIADCTQAYQKAMAVRKKISASDIFMPYKIQLPISTDTLSDKTYAKYLSGGTSGFRERTYVTGFAKNGIYVSKDGHGADYFVITNDTDRLTGSLFQDDYIYARDGNHKYTATNGAMLSIPAYRKTEYKQSAIALDTYLKDKTLSCKVDSDSDGKIREVIPKKKPSD